MGFFHGLACKRSGTKQNITSGLSVWISREKHSHVVVVNRTPRDYGRYVRFMHCLDKEARQMSAAIALKRLFQGQGTVVH
jgi:hypothetical protein